MADDSVQPVPWVARPSEARRGEAVDLAAGQQQVDDLLAGAVAALDQHRRSVLGQPPRQLDARGFGPHARRLESRRPRRRPPRRRRRRLRPDLAPQALRLRQVRGDDGGERQQVLDQRRHRLVGEQRVAALRHHHRVEDHRRTARRPGPVVGQPLGHGDDDRGVGEHADLHRVDAEVVEHRVDLRRHQLGRQRQHRGHRPRVLRRHRGQRAHPVGAVGGEGLEVRLDAGAAAGVRAGDGQQAGRDGRRSALRRRRGDGGGSGAGAGTTARSRRDGGARSLPVGPQAARAAPPAAPPRRQRSHRAATRTSSTRLITWARVRPWKKRSSLARRNSMPKRSTASSAPTVSAAAPRRARRRNSVKPTAQMSRARAVS